MKLGPIDFFLEREGVSMAPWNQSHIFIGLETNLDIFGPCRVLIRLDMVGCESFEGNLPPRILWAK
jgi:hypothetical protein